MSRCMRAHVLFVGATFGLLSRDRVTTWEASRVYKMKDRFTIVSSF